MPSSAYAAVAAHWMTALLTTVPPVGFWTTTRNVALDPAGTVAAASCVMPRLTAVATTVAVAVAELLVRPMSSAAVAVIVLLMVPLWMTLIVALTVNVSWLPAGSVGTVITVPVAGHT